MIKFGTHNWEQVLKRQFKSLLGRDKRISITLYPEVIQNLNDNELAERILLLFTDERGAYKRTYHNRFGSFDDQVLACLNRCLDPQQPFVFQDVAVSDGRTAVDFFQKIVLSYPNVQYVASDYNPLVYVLESGDVKITLSGTGKVLETVFPPFVFGGMRREKYYPINYLISSWVDFWVVSPLLKQYKLGKMKAKELLLFAPQALKLAEHDLRFCLAQHDLLKPFKGSSDVIRAMNVLNLSYFSELEFLRVLGHIYDGLKESGVFITGSNQEAGTVVNGGIYKKNKAGFEMIEQFGRGSPIAPLISTFQVK